MMEDGGGVGWEGDVGGRGAGRTGGEGGCSMAALGTSEER